jgi:hypothetical protein
MFIIEAILKYIKKDKFNEILETHDREQCEHLLDYIPLEEDRTTEEDLNCEHIFMPVDSTGEILACSKCGEIRKREELKDINFFHKEK